MACSAIVYGIEPKEESLLRYLLDEQDSQKNKSSDENTLNQVTGLEFPKVFLDWRDGEIHNSSGY